MLEPKPQMTLSISSKCNECEELYACIYKYLGHDDFITKHVSEIIINDDPIIPLILKGRFCDFFLTNFTGSGLCGDNGTT